MTKHPGRFRIAASRGVVLSLAFSIPLLGWLLPASGLGAAALKPASSTLSDFEFAPGASLDGWMALGPFEKSAEESTSTSLAVLVGSPGSAPDLDGVVWRGELPFVWVPARAGAGGRLPY